MLGVSASDVAVIVAVTTAVALGVFLRYRALLFTTFDPEVAAVSGVNTGRVDLLLMLMLTVSVLVSMNVMGVTLVAAAIVIPVLARRARA